MSKAGIDWPSCHNHNAAVYEVGIIVLLDRVSPFLPPLSLLPVQRSSLDCGHYMMEYVVLDSTPCGRVKLHGQMHSSESSQRVGERTASERVRSAFIREFMAACLLVEGKIWHKASCLCS